jgi:hypothetical protein
MTMWMPACMSVVLGLAVAGPALAQTATQAPVPPRVPRPGLWVVAGGGGVLARGHCGTCDRSGVFLYSPGLLVDVGVRVNPRVDAGVEFVLVRSRIEDLEPVRTTFVLGVGQFRPWTNRAFSIRAGMGIGFVGNGLYTYDQPNPAPPFTTNAIALTLGMGWEFVRQRRVTLQILATQHVVALGELTTATGSIKNVVGNYWLVGGALVIR